MLTSEIIDEMVMRFNGRNRDGDYGILRYLNLAHQILMQAEVEQNTIFDTSTGKLPYLVTTDETFLYPMATNVWRISGVLVRIENRSFLRFDDYERGGLHRHRHDWLPKVIGGIEYLPVPNIRSTDCVRDGIPATVMFTRNPGTYDKTYHLWMFKRPTQIVSESIQPDIPEPYDMEYLVPATAKLIEGAMNGDYVNAREYIEKELKPQFWKVRNAGDQGAYDNEPMDRGAG
jgi:hypothetical protein